MEMGNLNNDCVFDVMKAQQLKFLGVIIALWLYFFKNPCLQILILKIYRENNKMPSICSNKEEKEEGRI